MRITQRDNILFNTFSKSLALFANQAGDIIKDFTGSLSGVPVKVYTGKYIDIKIYTVQNTANSDYLLHASIIRSTLRIDTDTKCEILVKPQETELILVSLFDYQNGSVEDPSKTSIQLTFKLQSK